MRLVWEGRVRAPFVVREIQAQMPNLAYTTVMTTLNRLAEKGLLAVNPVPGQRAHEYKVAQDPEQYLAAASQHDVDQMIQRYGDVALAAFADRLDRLSSSRRERLRKLIEP